MTNIVRQVEDLLGGGVLFEPIGLMHGDIAARNAAHAHLRNAIRLLTKYVQQHESCLVAQETPIDAGEKATPHPVSLRERLNDLFMDDPLRHELTELLSDRGFVPKAELDAAHKQIGGLRREIAEHRRHVATVMQREDGLRKEVAELERRLAERDETISNLELKLWHAQGPEDKQRDADAEVGRAIRELRPKKGCYFLYINVTWPYTDLGTRRYRLGWRTKHSEQMDLTTEYVDLADAIAEYNKRED